MGSNKNEKRKPKSAVYRSFWASVVYFHLRLISTKSHKGEMTRNQFAGNRTWVRIPPSPPRRSKRYIVCSRLSLDACRVQALFLCQNERTASQPLQTDRVSKKIPNASAFGIFSFRFSRFAPPPPYLHSPCVQPLPQNDCENPVVHIQAAAMSAEKVSPVEKRRPSLLEYSLS